MESRACTQRREDRFHDLGFPEQFTLWAIRTWVHGQLTGHPVDALLTQAFEKVQAPDGRDLLRHFMLALAQGVSRTLSTNCPHCQAVTEDERLLLGVIGSLQRSGPREAAFELAQMVRPEWCSTVAFSANLLAACLARCGLALSAGAAAQAHAVPTREPAWEGGMRTLH